MYKMLKTTFSDNSKGITQTFKWFSQFKHGRTLVQDYEHSDRPSTGRTNKNLEKVHKIVYGDQQSIMSDIAGLLYRTCQQTVIEDLNMWWISQSLCLSCSPMNRSSGVRLSARKCAIKSEINKTSS
jgi:hypothetical protein